MKTPRIGHILLATDGSSEAEAAVNTTIVFAKAAAASVDVVHVWNLEVHHRHRVWDVETRSEAESLLNDTVMHLRAAGIPTDGEIMRADATHVASAIAEYALHHPFRRQRRFRVEPARQRPLAARDVRVRYQRGAR